MKTVLVTGSAGLVGSEVVRFFHEKGFHVLGIDNDLRKYFFGEEGSTQWNLEALKEECPRFVNKGVDIRDRKSVMDIFSQYNSQISLVIHTAAQPSHDWAAREPFTDFEVNATGTLNLLEATRQYCPQAVFIFTSTNKVYGDNPNRLPLVEQETRWEIDDKHPYHAQGIDEYMSLDHCTHSIFGASKLAADVLVQEYGRYFGMKTGVFRGGCLTGPRHSGAELHGFLAYLMKCALTGREYRIFGYNGKQVRDNIHSFDLTNAFYHFYLNPRPGEAYNIGGSRFSNCSLLEAIAFCEKISLKTMKTSYVPSNRTGDHIWWISDVSKFASHYPQWRLTKNIEDILREIYDYNCKRWLTEVGRQDY
ncbi:MAG: NAD-dependent epimerase/dehydratase family protein [Candidatus Omnitrophica bacterium]|nr:NAD-dependent epimerase/dehydratase family protein [Candidatus Omnitrophota bacterium]